MAEGVIEENAGKAGSFLKKKYGPLPVWGWAFVVLGAGVGVWLFLRKRSVAATGTTAAFPQMAGGFGGGGAPITTSSGSGGDTITPTESKAALTVEGLAKSLGISTWRVEEALRRSGKTLGELRLPDFVGIPEQYKPLQYDIVPMPGENVAVPLKMPTVEEMAKSLGISVYRVQQAILVTGKSVGELRLPDFNGIPENAPTATQANPAPAVKAVVTTIGDFAHNLGISIGRVQAAALKSGKPWGKLTLADLAGIPEQEAQGGGGVAKATWSNPSGSVSGTTPNDNWVKATFVAIYGAANAEAEWTKQHAAEVAKKGY